MQFLTQKALKMVVFKPIKFQKFIVYFFACMLILSACNRGTGCPAEEANTKTNKKGMPTSKSKSGLFDKKMTKKMNK